MVQMKRVFLLLVLGVTLSFLKSEKLKAQTPQAASTSESLELLEDNFFYEFKDGKPTAWLVEGATTEVTGGKCYNSSTGSALGLVTTEKEGFVKQIVDLTKEASVVKKGDELQGMIHYCTDASERKEGPFRLACQFLDAQGQAIQIEESNLINNSKLYFGRKKTYGEFKFRVVVPENATKFEFVILVDKNSSVRLDDFSLLRLVDADKTAFISLLPQYATIEGAVGKKQEMVMAFQGLHLSEDVTASYSGNGGFQLAEATLPKAGKTIATTLAITPSKKGVYLMGRFGGGKLTFSSSSGVASQFLANLYIMDPASPPTLGLKEEIKAFLVEPEKTQDLMCELSTAGIIDHVKLRLENNDKFAFRLNTTFLYYSSYQEKLLANKFRLTFAPREVGEYKATLVVTTSMGKDLRVELSGKAVKMNGDLMSEQFRADNALDPRFVGRDEWKDFHKFDLGYWYLEGKWLESGKVAIKSQGMLAFDELFPNGLKEVKVESPAGSEILQGEYSLDGGGHWVALQSPVAGLYTVNQTRPVWLRFINKSNGEVELNKVTFTPYTEELRTKFAGIEEAVLLGADKTAQTLLNENFNASRHTRHFSLPNWQNIIIAGDIPAQAWHQKDRATGNVEEICPRFCFMKWGKTDDRPHQAWLLSPTLTLDGAKSKIVTFRLRYQTPTPQGQEKFGFYILAEKEGALKSTYVELKDFILPTVSFDADQWLDFFINLDKLDKNIFGEKFHLAFFLDSKVGGNATSLNFMIDDVTFGRDDFPIVNVDKEMLKFSFIPKVKTEAQELSFTTERAKDPINLIVVPQKKVLSFELSESRLPSQGGKVDVTFKSDKKEDQAAAILVQMRGAEPKLVRLLAQKVNSICPLTEKTSLTIYPTRVVNDLHIAGDYASYAIYTLNGERVAEAKATSQISVAELPAGNYMIRLYVENEGCKSLMFEKK